MGADHETEQDPIACRWGNDIGVGIVGWAHGSRQRGVVLTGRCFFLADERRFLRKQRLLQFLVDWRDSFCAMA